MATSENGFIIDAQGNFCSDYLPLSKGRQLAKIFLLKQLIVDHPNIAKSAAKFIQDTLAEQEELE